MKLPALFVTAVWLAIISYSCAYNKGEDIPYPNVSYQTDIRPILISNCYTCHSDTASNPDNPLSFRPDLRWDHFDTLKTYALASSPVEGYSILLAQVEHKIAPGMPYNRPMLSEIDRNKIKSWVRKGAPKN